MDTVNVQVSRKPGYEPVRRCAIRGGAEATLASPPIRFASLSQPVYSGLLASSGGQALAARMAGLWGEMTCLRRECDAEASTTHRRAFLGGGFFRTFSGSTHPSTLQGLLSMSTAHLAYPNRGRLFLGCFISLIATAFGFVIRSLILGDWQRQYGFTETEVGNIFGAGLAPFAISIILFSLVIDRLGYGRTMVFAFVCHVLSAWLTITADSYGTFYLATFIFALGNGAVEAVINPVVATVYSDNKTHWLNILHAGWPGGLVLGGVLTIMMGRNDTFFDLPGQMWQWKVGLVLIPTLLYGILLLGVKFPVSERVSAGVSYKEMLSEFGIAGFLVVATMLVIGTSQTLQVWNIILPQWAIPTIIIGATLLFATQIRTLGQPIFVFLMLIMVPLAITELGTDSWIAKLMEEILAGGEDGAAAAKYGPWVLIYTSAIMFVLRFFAGPIVHRISPLGLLCVCAAIAATGLFWLSNAKTLALVFAAATCYGIGKTFFWPTTLGVVAERFPKGGALTLNSIAGVGMLSAGILGAPLIGYVQDTGLVAGLEKAAPQIAPEYVEQKAWAFLKYDALNNVRFRALKAEVEQPIEAVRAQEFQSALETLPPQEQQAYQPLGDARAALTQAEGRLLALEVELENAKAAAPKAEAGAAAAKEPAVAAAEEALAQQKKVVDELRVKERVARTDQALAALRAVDAKLEEMRVAPDYMSQFDAKVAAEVPADRQAEYDKARQELETIRTVERESKQAALAKIAILPCIMFVCYVLLILYFRAKGGYKAEVLTGHAAVDEQFTGGMAGPVG